MTESQDKPTKYYVDFENVHGAGLKGVDALDERDEVVVIYSQAAETFHIEHAIDILKSKAHIEFVEVDGGTRNAADFQLIVALFGNMDEAFDYVIVSGDTGFDAAIKMGERMGLPSVCRLANIRGDIEVEKTEKPKSRRSRRSRSGRDAIAETDQQPQEPQPESARALPEEQIRKQPDQQAEKPIPPAIDAQTKAVEAQPDDQSEGQATSPKRRTRRRRRSNGSQDGMASPQPETALKTDESTEDTADTVSAEDATAKTQKTPAATEKGAASRAHEEARQDTAAARARAAEAMRLAFAESAKEVKEAAASETATVEQCEATLGAEERNVAELIKALLSERGVELTDAQLATVTSAIDGANGRQDFYRRIIKIERQQKGRALYRQVREHYEALVEAARG